MSNTASTVISNTAFSMNEEATNKSMLKEKKIIDKKKEEILEINGLEQTHLEIKNKLNNV